MALFTSRPIANVNSLWSANDYSLINDVVLEPSSSADASTYARAGRNDDYEQQIWRLDNIPVTGTIESAEIWLRHHFYDDGDYIVENIDVQMGFGATLEPSVITTYTSTGGWSWSNALFSGSWTSAQFADFRVGVNPGSVSTREDYMLGALYADLTYTASGGGGGNENIQYLRRNVTTGRRGPSPHVITW